jgi:hypothetical protein
MTVPTKRFSLEPHQTALLFAAGFSLIIWAIPLLSRVFLPLIYVNTYLHELCHAMAGQITGADIDMIRINADGSGTTPMAGGNIWLIGPAGYMGATLLGALIIWFSRTESGARNVLRTLAIVLAMAMLLWVRGDFVGVIAGIGWIATLVAGSVFLKGMPLLFAAQFVGVQQCLNAITSVYTLLQISAISETQSDALIMQNHSGIPAFFWAFGWCAFSLVLVSISLRHAWIRRVRPQAESPASGS